MSGQWAEVQRLDWSRFQAVIFDLDGTLYDQKQLRRKMALELILFHAFRPHRLRDVKILSTFRHLREQHFEREESSLVQAQYRWTAEKLNVPIAAVQRVVDEWIHRRPLKHLPACRPPGLAQMFERLHARGLRIGVFSDYPVAEKLRALQLTPHAAACATDHCVNRLKPHPAGLQHILSQLKAAPRDTLHIGDRPERDAICAEKAGCASLVLPAHHATKLGASQSYDLLFP